MTPAVHVVAGIAAEPVSLTTFAMQCELPDAVVLTFEMDAARGAITRQTRDLMGVHDAGEQLLEHACLTCAIREEILPAIELAAASGRWRDIIVRLPLGSAATSLVRVLRSADYHEVLSVSGVAVALDASRLCADFVTDEELRDRGLHCRDDDERGVAEACAELTEYSDVVVLHGEPEPDGADFVRALVRPGCLVTPEWSPVTGQSYHDAPAIEAWVAHVRTVDAPPVASPHVWQAELYSHKPFHPERLVDHIETLGGGWSRSRGSFWVATRPDMVALWDSAGGSLAIGGCGEWGFDVPATRIFVTGLTCQGDDLDAMRDAFDKALLTDDEFAALGNFAADEDGLEPWLGPIIHSTHSLDALGGHDEGS